MESPADHDPGHQQPCRKCRRTATRPATGTSVAPVPPPITHVTQLPHPIEPDVRPAFMKAGGGYRPEARHPPTRTGPHAPANLRGGRVRARGPGSAQGETRGPRMCPPRASRCPCTFSGWLFMVWRSWVVFAAGSSPRHPPRKEHVHVGGRVLDRRSPLKTRVVCTSDQILVSACLRLLAAVTSATNNTSVLRIGLSGYSLATAHGHGPLKGHPLLHGGFRMRPHALTPQGITCRLFTRDGL